MMIDIDSIPVKSLKRHDPVEIEWIDASESDVEDIDIAQLPNKAVETRMKEIGWYLGVQKGRTWRESHLLFYFRMTDGRYRVSSIPLPLVKRIIPLEVKKARKYGLITPETPVQRRLRHRERIPGGVKHLRAARG